MINEQISFKFNILHDTEIKIRRQTERTRRSSYPIIIICQPNLLIINYKNIMKSYTLSRLIIVAI